MASLKKPPRLLVTGRGVSDLIRRSLVTDGRRKKTVEERFWDKVSKTDECWLWTAGLTASGGYGVFHPDKTRSVRAHRLSYELIVGPIPRGMQLDHICHTPACVRPDHLRPVTNKQNSENTRVSKNNTSGHRGVSWHKGAKKWRAHLMHNRRQVHLGLFVSKQEAVEAVRAARLRRFTHSDMDLR